MDCMEDDPIRADGGPQARLDRITEIADEMEELGKSIQSTALSETNVVDAEGTLHGSDAPAPEEFDDHDEYLEEAQAWVTDELRAAGSDLEHRTVELRQALEVYPGINDDRSEADTRRDVVVEDLAEVAGAVERLLVAGAQLARLEESQTDA